MSVDTATTPETKTPTLPETKGGLIPYLMLDAAAASAFYQKAFGAIEVARMPAPDNPNKIIHLHLYLNGHSLMLNDPMPEHGYPAVPHQGYTLTLIVDDADAWFDRAVAAGAKGVMPVQKMFWGDRYGQVDDPFGVRWAINQPAR